MKMSEKHYDVELPVTCSRIRYTKSELKVLKERIEKVLAEAKRDEPKPWDIIVIPGGHFFVRLPEAEDNKEWLADDGTCTVEDNWPAIQSGQYLGNLREILEQGQILVGMPLVSARRIVNDSVAVATVRRNVQCALDRYDEAQK
jgi:hypothetical protein